MANFQIIKIGANNFDHIKPNGQHLAMSSFDIIFLNEQFNLIMRDGSKTQTINVFETDVIVGGVTYTGFTTATLITKLQSIGYTPYYIAVSSGNVVSIASGTGISIDATDPTNPIISCTISGEIVTLSDVSITSLTNGQVLAWNSTTNKWENITINILTPNLQQVTDGSGNNETTNPIIAKELTVKGIVGSSAYSLKTDEYNTGALDFYYDSSGQKAFSIDFLSGSLKLFGLGGDDSIFLRLSYNNITQERVATFPDKDIIVAGTDDIPTTATELDALKRDGSNANSDVDLNSYSVKTKRLTIGNPSTQMELSSDNLLDNKTAQWQNIDYVGIADITDVDNAVSNLKDGVSTTGDTLQKLYNLILGTSTQDYVANIVARNAYDIPHLPFSLFVTDDGDGKWAIYQATTTGVGATFVKISDPDLLNAVMSNSAIKIAYESNSDTNAFTNALKTIVQAQSGTNTGDNATNSQYSGLASLKEDTVNKSTSTSDSASSVKFPVWSAVVTYVTSLGYQTASQVGILITNALASFKATNFLDFTSSGQTQIDNKVNKVTGKSLILDTEISRIGTMATNANVGVIPNTVITGSTKTKITYDSKGLVTSGVDATQDDILDGSTNRSFTNVEKTKLSGIASGATTNSSDATLLSRENHTGTQLSSTISDIQSTITNNTAVLANTAKVTNANHTGDATGSNELTLATVNSNVGTVGSANKTVTVKTNAKGLTTSIYEQNIQIAESQVTGLVADLASKQNTLTDANFGTFVSGLNTKTTVVDDDNTNFSDSEDSSKSKKVTALNFYNYLKTKLDSFFAVKAFRIRTATAYTDLVGGTGLRTMFGTSFTAEANSCYEFEVVFSLSSISATSGTFSFGILGTAGIANILYNADANKNATLTNSLMMTFSVTIASALSASTTSTTARASIKGIITTNATVGTIIPAYAVSVSANPVTDANSIFKITKIGSNTFTNG